MGKNLAPWQYILLLIFIPPLGAFLICTNEEIKPLFKTLAVLYCAVVFLIVLNLRLPAGEIIIDAQPMG